MSSAAVDSARPSDARRAMLKEADAEIGNGRGIPLVSNFFPIERYYAAADKVFSSFQQAYDDRRLDDAYVYGKRFAAFSMDALPNHAYYRLPKYAKWRSRNGHDMAKLISQLEQIAKWMDAEEAIIEKQRKEMELKFRQQKDLERRKMKDLQARIESQRIARKKQQPQKVAMSAIDKLNQMNKIYPVADDSRQRPSSPQQVTSDQMHTFGNIQLPNPPSQGGVPMQAISNVPLPLPIIPPPSRTPPPSALFSPPKGPLPPKSNIMLPPALPPPSSGVLTPTAPPPTAPPSYDQISSPKEVAPAQSHNGNHVYPIPFAPPAYVPPPMTASVGGAIVPPRSSSHPTAPGDRGMWQDQRLVRRERKTVRQMRDKYAYDYKLLRQQGKIEIFGLGTYQGRNSNSTNGCTVISPLVVANHLRSGHAISDSTIVDVIDRQCVPILREIRSKLQLEGAALIIPSDVHDYMVDHKILSQGTFAGATGGNITDKQHLGDFLKLLEKGDSGDHINKRSGAALFFREHVISIVKVPTGNGRFVYDLVDSLPKIVDPDTGRSMATRTRCRDLNCLYALLKWYACSKFSDANCTYIDKNEWDESMADFDPRVFQSFVWAD